MKKQKYVDLIVIIVLIFGAVIMIMPFWVMVALSFETPQQTNSIPPILFPIEITFNNYINLFSQLNFAVYFRNSLFLTVIVVFGQVISSLMAGYAFARLNFPFKNLIFIFFLSMLMVPSVVIIIPEFILLKYLHLINTIIGVGLMQIFSAFGTFLFRQNFLSIPTDFEEAAIIDGASLWRIFWQIMVPLTLPSIAAFSFLSFVYGWTMFLWPLVALSSTSTRTLPIGLSLLQGQFFSNWGVMMAGSVIVSIPAIIVFLFLQKQFVNNMLNSGIK
jgi:multiple sugar transport system permease protein